MTSADLNTVLPELALAVFAMLALMVGVYGSKDKMTGTITWASAGLMVILAFLIGWNGEGARDGSGHIGILTAKDAKNAKNINVCAPPTI